MKTEICKDIGCADINCEQCKNLKGTCFKHSPPRDRKFDKDMYVSRAVAMGAEPEEAIKHWEDKNK
ncbi:MAG: hypothetical protein WCO06_01435 [Candidatus Roizmanbacteria bacterium]